LTIDDEDPGESRDFLFEALSGASILLAIAHLYSYRMQQTLP